MRKSQPKKISLRVDLEGDEANRCIFLKNQRGLKNFAELVRQLITEAAKREQSVPEVPAR